ncbi:hypothetical protein [Paenibacillus sp. YYML68]|uniref:hypothetical protein n=1 Tax=Paenibacillus sp. YYML68 TaxID=2909250 RepID=UPI00248F9D02|nr:hypothetical protein [Paenibacillus sp. YYML68]
MAFGVNREQLAAWKEKVSLGEIAYLTHYWIDDRFPGVTSVTKVGCADLERLTDWCTRHGLSPRYIHRRAPYPHFDLMGAKQKEVLLREGLYEHMERFRL